MHESSLRLLSDSVLVLHPANPGKTERSTELTRPSLRASASLGCNFMLKTFFIKAGKKHGGRDLKISCSAKCLRSSQVILWHLTSSPPFLHSTWFLLKGHLYVTQSSFRHLALWGSLFHVSAKSQLCAALQRELCLAHHFLVSRQTCNIPSHSIRPETKSDAGLMALASLDTLNEQEEPERFFC